MKKTTTLIILALLISFFCSNLSYAETTTETNLSELKKQAPIKKIDLKAIVFDPDTDIKAQATEENREMTSLEEAQYNIHEALHGEVSAVGTKGLLEDKMKMTFDSGPIASIAPWVSYNGSLSNIWSNENYQNTNFAITVFDVGINGKLRDGKTLFRVMISPAKSIEGTTYLQTLIADNYIIKQVDKNNQILIGNTWVPFGIEGKESPLLIPFFSRSQISRTYSTNRAIGTKVMGDYKLVEYNIGGYSSGRFFKDFFPGAEFAGTLSFKPLGMTDGKWGKIIIGTSMDAGNAESSFSVVGTHLIYEYKRLKASFEYATADGSNGSTGFSSNQSEGCYGTLAYRITPKLQALIRYDQFEPNKNKANDIRTEYTAGINYFIKGQALKLMLNFVSYTLENGTYGSRIMTGTQIVL